jgi:hypothetical protein
MARVVIRRTWPDGDRVTVEVEADDSYPDALDQARAVARRGFADVCGVVAELEAEAEGES